MSTQVIKKFKFHLFLDCHSDTPADEFIKISQKLLPP